MENAIKIRPDKIVNKSLGFQLPSNQQTTTTEIAFS